MIILQNFFLMFDLYFNLSCSNVILFYCFVLWQESEEVTSLSSDLEKQLESFASKLLEDEVSVYLKRKNSIKYLCITSFLQYFYNNSL